MKKKYLVVALSLGIIMFTACSEINKNQEDIDLGLNSDLSCDEEYVIDGGNGQNLDLKAKATNENVKNVLSNIAGIVAFLDCEKGEEVNTKTLIAKVKPDYSDPNIQNLVNQKNMLNTQIINVNGIINSTQSNFDTQLNSLNTQKSNLNTQLQILKDSYGKIDQQMDFGVGDIEKQLETLKSQLKTLETQINDLSNSKSKLEDSKKADIDKLESNLSNTKNQIKSIIGNILLKIAELYGISDENHNLNDAYDSFLGAKNLALKAEVKDERRALDIKFKDFENLSNSDISIFLDKLYLYINLVKDSIKDSVDSNSFPQTMIDEFYSMSVQFENSILSSKNGFDSILKSFDSVKNTYDIQILNMITQINAIENNKTTISTNIDNLKSNKLGSYTTSIDLQKNQTESQIQTLTTSLDQIDSQIQSLKSQEEIQLKQLNSQMTQLQSSINTININLQSQSIYAGIEGIIKQKVASVSNKIGPSSPLCIISPNQSSIKLQVFSSFDLILPVDINFEIEGKQYLSKLINKLPYHDPVTQNYIYETDNQFLFSGEIININDIISEGKVLNVNLVLKENVILDEKIYIPINYVSNTLLGTNVKLKTSDGSIKEQKIVLGELDGNVVEVRSGLEFGETICK